METLELKGETRKLHGTNEMKKLRTQGFIPCVLYGHKSEQKIFSIKKNDINKFIYTPNVYFINLDINGQTYPAKLQDVQFHPVREEVLHVDFYQINDEVPIVMNLPVRLIGTPIGVQKGGKMTQKEKFLKVSGLRKNIPSEINIDVSNVDLDQFIRIKDIKIPNVTLVAPERNAVVSVRISRIVVEETKTEAPKEAAAQSTATAAPAGTTAKPGEGGKDAPKTPGKTDGDKKGK